MENILIKFGSSVSYHCPRERFEHGFSIMSFLVGGPTELGTFNIHLDRTNLILNAKIVDFDDKVIGEIMNNKWEINRKMSFKRNFNSKAIEIIDSYGIRVLQFKIVSNSEIYTGGVIHYDNSSAIFCQDPKFRLVNYGASKNEVAKKRFFEKYIVEDRKIKSIF